MDWMVTEFKNAHGVDLSNDKMALQRLKEAAEKAKIELSSAQQTTINLPFITATSDGPLHLELELSRSKFQELTADLLDACRGPFEQAIRDAGLRQGPDRPHHPRGRLHAHARGRRPGARAHGQGPAQGCEPGRGRRRRRRDPGRRAEGRRQGRPAPRRHAAVARHRDEGPDLHEAHRAQHDDPDQALGGLHDRRGQPAQRRDPRAAGRERHGVSQQDARQVPARRHPAGAAGRAAGRSHVRHRRQRDRERVCEGPCHRQGAADDDHRRHRAVEGRHRHDGQGGRGARRGGPSASRGGRDPQQRRLARVPDREAAEGAGRQRLGGRAPEDRGEAQGAQGRPGRLRHRGGEARARGAPRGQPGVRAAAVPAVGPEPAAGRRGRRRDGRRGCGPSSAPSDDEVADAEIVDDDEHGGEQKGA